MTLANEVWDAREAPTFQQIYVASIGGMPFAFVFHPDQSLPPLDGQDRARARLAASAPRLARALRATIDACSGMPPDWLAETYSDGVDALIAAGPPFAAPGWGTENAR